jgi:hypothetical protein
MFLRLIGLDFVGQKYLLYSCKLMLIMRIFVKLSENDSIGYGRNQCFAIGH